MRLQIATFLLALTILVVDALTPAQEVISWAYVGSFCWPGYSCRRGGSDWLRWGASR